MSKQSIHTVSEADSPQVSGEDGMTHTPLPWRTEPETPDTYLCIRGEHAYVCTMDQQTGPEQSANADLIVRAVNSHAALVEALDECVGILELLNGPADPSISTRHILANSVAAAIRARVTLAVSRAPLDGWPIVNREHFNALVDALEWIAARPDEANKWDGTDKFRECRDRARAALAAAEQDADPNI